MVPPSWQSKTQCGLVVELGCVIAVQFGLCVREEVVQELLVTRTIQIVFCEQQDSAGAFIMLVRAVNS